MIRQARAGSRLGLLVRLFGSPKGILLLALQFVILALLLSWFAAGRSSDSCVYCHESHDRMEQLGFPQFTVTAEDAQRESRMPRTTCRDCHLGDGGSRDLERAHRGLLRPFIIDLSGNVRGREGIMPTILPSRDDPLRGLLPAVGRGESMTTHPEVLTVMWQDRNRETWGYDPEVGRKTCGRSDCHPAEVEQFDRTVMGANLRQRSTRVWNDVHGPNNCGPSFADVAPDVPAEANAFSDANHARIAADSNLSFSFAQARDKQQVCNLCHTGCLDCHYTPSREGGVHAFSRRPPSSSCAGGGRGTMLCHGGTLERRRGDNYLGGAYTSPAGMEGDAHLSQGMDCLDCHPRGPAGMGDMTRKARCSDCHIEAEEALAASVHRSMSCASCHVSRLGGYQQTTWGPGAILGKPNPFKKYSIYYGVLEPPVLMRDQEGVWTPYKVWGNSVGNISRPVEAQPGVVFRWPGGETRDAYALLGTFGDLPANNLHLAWIQFDQASHPLGPSRDCESCHGGRSQTSRSTWDYQDYQGARPFSGSHVVVADGEGLRIEEMKVHGEIEVREGSRLSDFAAWIGIGSRWRTSGDFSIPSGEPGRLQELRDRYRSAVDYVKREERRLGAGGVEGRKLKLKVRRLRETWLHNPEGHFPGALSDDPSL